MHVGSNSVPLAAARVRHGSIGIPCRTVRPVRRERVPHVRDRHDAPGSGMSVAREPVRVPRAVPALVVVADRRQRPAERIGTAHQVPPDLGVTLDLLPFIRVQLARLVQDLVRDAHLAHVVQERALMQSRRIRFERQEQSDPRRQLGHADGVYVVYGPRLDGADNAWSASGWPCATCSSGSRTVMPPTAPSSVRGHGIRQRPPMRRPRTPPAGRGDSPTTTAARTSRTRATTARTWSASSPGPTPARCGSSPAASAASGPHRPPAG